MRIMAIDYGKRRVGIAMSDPLGIIAQPYLTIDAQPKKALLKRLKEIIEVNDVGLVIIGYPLSGGTKSTKMTSEIKKFAGLLKKVINIEIKFWDERYTSQYAARILKKYGPKNIKGKIDKLAASIILEEYLKTI